jgi:hypothetical protein
LKFSSKLTCSYRREKLKTQIEFIELHIFKWLFAGKGENKSNDSLKNFCILETKVKNASISAIQKLYLIFGCIGEGITTVF